MFCRNKGGVRGRVVQIDWGTISTELLGGFNSTPVTIVAELEVLECVSWCRGCTPFGDRFLLMEMSAGNNRKTWIRTGVRLKLLCKYQRGAFEDGKMPEIGRAHV